MATFTQWSYSTLPARLEPMILPRPRSAAEEIRAWCEDEDRPGEFTILAPDYGERIEGKIYLWCSDPNIAFEARMRWG